jgi:hypothetical protein
MNALTLDPSTAISFDMSDQFPVTVAVTRNDGSVEQVRIGTATKTAEGFSISMGQMSIGSTAMPRAAAGAAGAARPAGAGGGDGMVFPPYGRSKGMPVRGGSMQDLEYYANGCKRTLNDPSKSRWHDKERVLLAAIEAEIARQGGGGGGGGSGQEEPPPPTDDDAPF